MCLDSMLADETVVSGLKAASAQAMVALSGQSLHKVLGVYLLEVSTWVSKCCKGSCTQVGNYVPRFPGFLLKYLGR
jgi:hypothetical protein